MRNEPERMTANVNEHPKKIPWALAVRAQELKEPRNQEEQ